MSYQEKNVIVSLVTTVLIAGFYGVNLLRMMQAGEPNPTEVYTLFGVVVVVSILANIASSILTNIVFAIIGYLRTQEEEEFFMDERDKLIELTGSRNGYYVFGLGVFIAMLTLILGMEPLVMFNLIVVSGFSAEVVNNLTQLYLYRRGF